MNTANIVIEYNEEHVAAINVLIASIIDNKYEESHYHIWIIGKEMPYTCSSNVDIECISDSSKLDNIIDKAIWLNWNTIVQGDLCDLYEFDMEGNSVAAVPNVPDIARYIPVSSDKYSRDVMLIDFSKGEINRERVKKLPLFYNLAYDELVQSSEKYDIETVKTVTKLEKTDFEIIKQNAVVLRYNKEFSPEKYFNHPYSELWTKYLLKSGHETIIPINRKSYIDTVGTELVCTDKNMIIPVALYIEDDDVAYTVALINSIIANHRTGENLDIRILHNIMSENHKQMLLKMGTDNVSINLYSVEKYTKEQALLYVSLLFNNYDKALWISSKMICNGDISELYGYDVQDNYIKTINSLEGTIPDEIYLENMIYPELSVVLLNISKWIQNDVNSKICYALNKKKNFQKAVYAVCKQQIGELPSKWNYDAAQYGNQKYLEHCNIYNYMKCVEDSKDFILKYLEDHIDAEKLKFELLNNTGKDGEDMKDTMEKIGELEKQKSELKKQNQTLKQQNEALAQEKEQILYELLETRKSFTYKVGRFITFIPRHLRKN